MFPPVTGSYDGIDLALLDAGLEDDRVVLIRAEHAFGEESDDVFPEPGIDGPDGTVHVAVHEVVADLILKGNPPQVWTTAQRLSGTGYDRHEVLHMLGSAVATQFWLTRSQGVPFDLEGFLAALDRLPESWETELGDDLDEDRLDEDVELLMPWPRAGTTFTHRLSRHEVEAQILAWVPDLEPLAPLACEGHLHLTQGLLAEFAVDDELGRVVSGPPGWLDGFGPGSLVGLRVVGDDDDEIEVVDVAEMSMPADFCERLRTSFEEANNGSGMPVSIVELVNGVLADPALPVLELPPVAEVFGGCAFEIQEGFAAPAGTDWDAFAKARAVASVAALQGLGVLDAQALVMVMEVLRLFVEGGSVLPEVDDGVLEGVAKVLADPDIGSAFVDVSSSVFDDDDLIGFTRQVASRVRRRHRAGVMWIAARAAARQGDHEGAEALLREALDAAPEHPLAVEDAAWFANDRGDARRAVELLGRLDDPDTEDRVQVLLPYAAPPPRPLARRNDPCPCGSGRKFKVCCLGADRRLPMPDRIGWIWTKLEWFLDRSGFEELVEEVVDALEAELPEEELLAVSLVLFPGGTVDAFLEQRGPLLPGDERDLVAQWARIAPSVHEVVEVTPGVGLVLRDVRTHVMADVRERLGSTQLVVGDLLYAHVVPDGHTHQIVGGVIAVPPAACDLIVGLLDDQPDVVDLADQLAGWRTPAR